MRNGETRKRKEKSSRVALPLFMQFLLAIVGLYRHKSVCKNSTKKSAKDPKLEFDNYKVKKSVLSSSEKGLSDFVGE